MVTLYTRTVSIKRLIAGCWVWDARNSHVVDVRTDDRWRLMTIWDYCPDYKWCRIKLVSYRIVSLQWNSDADPCSLKQDTLSIQSIFNCLNGGKCASPVEKFAPPVTSIPNSPTKHFT